MDPFVTPFVDRLDSVHEDIYKAVEPLTDAEINWRHPSLTNTIGILLRHTAGSERYWMVEVVGGRKIERDRDAEFRGERLEKATLVANLRAAQREVREVLARLTPADLSQTVELPYPSGTRTVPKQWAVLHSLTHTSYHLGQIQLFKKMAGSR